MYKWCVTVHRHPDLSSMQANLARIETIQRELVEFGFLVLLCADRRSRFWITHSSRHAWLHYCLCHGEIASATVCDSSLEMS